MYSGIKKLKFLGSNEMKGAGKRGGEVVVGEILKGKSEVGEIMGK